MHAGLRACCKLPGGLLALHCCTASAQEHILADSSIATASIPVLMLCTFFVVMRNRKMSREIARRRQSERDAAEEQSRLNAMLNNAGVGVLLADRSARHVDVNRHWCRMFGYQRHEARSTLTTHEITHPDEAAALDEHFRALLTGKIKSHSQAHRFVRKDGSVFWGLISTSTVKEKHGRRKWVVGIITDIDEQKRIEGVLRESEERLRFITENTHDVVWQLDRDLRFTYVNGADQRMRGYRREEVIGRNLKDVIVADGHPVIDQMMHRQYDQDGRALEACLESVEVKMRCKDGSQVWAEINTTLIRNNSGEVIGYVGVARDTTRRREHNEKLREQTIRDPLTGLFNRRYLDESLERELALAKHGNRPLSLLMIDLDHFKQLNDTCGHPAGDEVLKRLGELIRNGARSGDLPCRYGGEEFLLVLPNVAIEVALKRAEQWRKDFSAAQIRFGGVLLSPTFSVGVSSWPDHGNSPDELIKSADQALYAAKRQGRNCVVVASPKLLKQIMPDEDARRQPFTLP